MRDVDLAARLGYPRPPLIRRLIARMIEEGEITDVQQRSAVDRYESRPGIEQERTVSEYWLTEEQAYQVSQRSKGPQAADVRRESHR